MTDFAALLRELTRIPAISGHEGEISAFMAERLRADTSAVEIDQLYNVVARFGAGERKIAICAHMDTVGLMVKRINGDGSLGVIRVGGANLKALSGAAVRVGERTGVIGVRSQHLERVGDEAVKNDDDLYIDVGDARDIEITTPITYAPQEVMLEGGYYCAPHLDNRAGCAVLLGLAEQLAANPPPCTVYLIGTVQEETTCIGAYSALQRIAPDEAIFADGTVSYDTLETQGHGSVTLGSGAVLTAFLYVSGLNGWHAHPRIRARLKEIAQVEKIPFQQDAITGLMSDARAALPLGIPSAIVGIPMRGKHAPLETVNLNDLAACAQLIGTYVRHVEA
jgi:putative aminopeptidase FrvX